MTSPETWALIGKLSAAWVALTVFASNVWRALPEAERLRLEYAHPRIANTIRALRKGGNDARPALAAAWLVVTGKPWPFLPPLPESSATRESAAGEVRK